MKATINVAGTSIATKTDIRVLGLQIDTQLKWGPHVKKVLQKMTQQTLALTALSTSTWGASLLHARRIYNAVVKPAMTYASAIWHLPNELRGTKSNTAKLSPIQNRCLRAIAGAYKATPIPVLEAETYSSPLPLLLDSIQMDARRRLTVTGMRQLIHKSCLRIVEKLNSQRGRPRHATATPGARKHSWHKQRLLKLNAETKLNRAPERSPPWEKPSQEGATLLAEARQQRQSHRQIVRASQLENWRSSWSAYLAALQRAPSPAQSGEISKQRLRIHRGLAKAQSSLTTQLRTNKIGFADFLFKQNVPDIPSPSCECGWRRQTAQHVVMDCPLLSDRHKMLAAAGTTDYRRLLDDPKALKIVTLWLMKARALPQFSFATEQLCA